eukprot:CAMPEP_0174380662 /NCGR_PEP_ID=MMETSP0811_2-20130205/123516_1 /TAXON_ID=73025 ORGANISM="Eutreptiella gymnastica-like, Strain CCMP1594" /NCGR_SAMPLE_ID=MMETSP0811_2 /ASSEMBLY_ACC=CAM_ASM_000667 /LENGTH=126 /DNA_ID=CAMNT_0015533589 /DNA_START=3175 /DNA_END=3552 /DNA_ORIENTATION=+
MAQAECTRAVPRACGQARDQVQNLKLEPGIGAGHGGCIAMDDSAIKKPEVAGPKSDQKKTTGARRRLARCAQRAGGSGLPAPARGGAVFRRPLRLRGLASKAIANFHGADGELLGLLGARNCISAC